MARQFPGGIRSNMQWSVVAWSFLLLSGAVGSDESIIQSPKQITVTEGGTVRMNCAFGNKGIGAIGWYKDVETHTISNWSGDYHGRVLQIASHGILNVSIEITDLKMTEAGRYYCQVSVFPEKIYNGHGTEVTVTRAAGSDESIIQSPTNITVTEGGTVRINCTFVGKTNSSMGAISWYKDVETRTVDNEGGDYYGRVLKKSFRKNGSPEILKESIEITDLKMNETGKYYCRVNGSTGEIYNGHGTEVNVTRAVGSAESIIQSPTQVTVTEGGTVRLNCGKTSSSLGAISWYVDVQTRIVSNTSGDYYGRVLKKSSAGILNESIEIIDLKMNETGKYYCQVTDFKEEIHNGHGTEVTVTRNLADSTDVTVTRSDRGGNESHSNQDYILPLVYALLGLALLGMVLILIIFLRRRGRSPDKGTGTENGAKENDTSTNIIYADLNIKKSTRNHRSGHGARENGARVKDPGGAGPLSAAGGYEDSVVYSALKHPAPTDNPASAAGGREDPVVYSALRHPAPMENRASAAGGREDPVVYSALRHPAPTENPASSKQKKNPRRKEQQVVYATVNAQRPPVRHH